MPSHDEASVLADMGKSSDNGHELHGGLTLAAEQAESEAAEAEAIAAHARAKAIQMRRAAMETEEVSAVEVGPDSVASADADAIETPAAAEADVADDSETDAAAAEGTSAAPQRSSRGVILTVVVATLSVMSSLGLLGLGCWMMLQHNRILGERQQRADYAAGASQDVVNLMTLDFNHAKLDVQRIIDSTAGDFKKDFEAQAGDFVKVAESSKAMTVATVNATSVQSMTGNSANVLLAVTTRVSNAASKEQQPRSWRLSVDVVRDGGQIKLVKVEFVP